MSFGEDQADGIGHRDPWSRGLSVCSVGVGEQQRTFQRAAAAQALHQARRVSTPVIAGTPSAASQSPRLRTAAWWL